MIESRRKPLTASLDGEAVFTYDVDMSRRRKAKQLEQVNLLDMVPVRLATWSEVKGRVVLERPCGFPPEPQGRFPFARLSDPRA